METYNIDFDSASRFEKLKQSANSCLSQRVIEAKLPVVENFVEETRSKEELGSGKGLAYRPTSKREGSEWKNRFAYMHPAHPKRSVSQPGCAPTIGQTNADSHSKKISSSKVAKIKEINDSQ